MPCSFLLENLRSHSPDFSFPADLPRKNTTPVQFFQKEEPCQHIMSQGSLYSENAAMTSALQREVSKKHLLTLQVSDRPESYEKTLLIAVSQFWGQPFQNVQRFKKGPQNKTVLPDAAFFG